MNVNFIHVRDLNVLLVFPIFFSFIDFVLIFIRLTLSSFLLQLFLYVLSVIIVFLFNSRQLPDPAIWESQ
jgi:hypothetical protein